MTKGQLPALGMVLGLCWFVVLVIPYGMFKAAIQGARALGARASHGHG